MPQKQILLMAILGFFGCSACWACSMFYYVDPITCEVYVANNEDSYFDFSPYIQIEPKSQNHFARLWYGWDNFAQGGINEKGLFYDVAVTPHQGQIKGRKKFETNLGDEMLSKCKDIREALQFIESMNVLFPDAHIMLGDASGEAVVVEWIGFEKRVVTMKDNKLVATNFLLEAPELGGQPCWRYNVINKELGKLRKTNELPNLDKIGAIISRVAQAPREDKTGRKLGTLYTSFINISTMEFNLVYKREETCSIKFDLESEFETTEVQKIEFY